VPLASQSKNIAEQIAAIPAIAEQLQASADGFEVTVYAVPPNDRQAAELIEAGADRIVFALPAVNLDLILRTLDRCASIAGDLS
jgi:hypothetical protein